MPVCTVLTSQYEVESLANAWRDLHRRIGLAPFTDYDWAMVWWQTIGEPAGAELLVVACHDGDRLVGVLPFTIRIKNGVRVLRLLGHEVYYYRNFLIEDPACVPMMWQTALQQKSYDFANIKNIHEGTPDHDFMTGRATILDKSRVFYCLHEGLCSTALLAQRSKDFRRKYRNVQKKIESAETLGVGLCNDGSYAPALIDYLVRQKKAWTIERGKRGIFNEQNTLAFYRGIARLGAAKGILLLNWIHDGPRYFGVTLSFVEKDVVYGHTLAIDMAYSRFMPGIFLNMEAMIWACDHGFNETNFMEGEEEYKQRFAKQFRVICEYATARTLKGQAYLALYRLLRLYRRLKTPSATKKIDPKG